MSVSYTEQINTINTSNGVVIQDDKVTTKEEDVLGRDTFLTMLVAQLKNQDPLNPMDGTDFSAQLAEFSQLEQLMNLNDSMKELTTAFTSQSDLDATSYIGKEVSGKVDNIDVSGGIVTGGYFNLSQAGDVKVTIYDSEGKQVRTIFEGQKGAGPSSFSWDGKDSAGNRMPDGSYTYSVSVNSGFGYTDVANAVTGKVEGVVYNEGKPYLVVEGALVNPESLLSVKDTEQEQSQTEDTALSYLGKEVTTTEPKVLVENGTVSGQELNFELGSPEDSVIKIKNASGQVVRTITVDSDSTVTGINKVQWDGLDDSGEAVSDGLYSYEVEISGGNASISHKEEVTGIKYINQTQYLVLQESGRLVSLSAISGVS